MNRNTIRHVVAALVVSAGLASCDKADSGMRFELLSPEITGIHFENTIQDTDSLNILKFEYLYNGAGVGIGDFNNDGLQDVFFAGNMVSSRLYLNSGNFTFRDVTVECGVSTDRWCTGVAVGDINQDGWDDIYISTINPERNGTSANILFINRGLGDQDGIPHFEEVAGRMGLADSTYSTQAAFLDYDVDGDLDLYLVNNSLEDFSRHTPYGQRQDGTGKSVDRLYRNDGDEGSGLPHFTNVSRQANIMIEGWGLGVVVNDFNNDGFPDIYVTNDFLSNDHLYINNQDGTFTNQIAKYLKHQEYNGMGVDAADINNDGLNEIVGVDMMPDDNLRQKAMFSNIGYDRFWLNRERAYQDQYVRNVLQFNNGNQTFSDIGYLSGIYCTDWSWSALFADYDNDGHRDLLITNGYPKDVTDLDFTTYGSGSYSFGTQAARLKNALADIRKLVGVKKANFIFRNNKDLTFVNKANDWGLHHASYSNGAAYADFDNDGDLDLVMNNINDKAFLYRNDVVNKDSRHANFLRIAFKTGKGNSNGLGAKVKVHVNGGMQYAEHQQQRGYKSTVEPLMHFGLGKAERIDSLEIVWTNGTRQVLRDIEVNQVITLKGSEANLIRRTTTSKPAPLFDEVHRSYELFYRHADGNFVDFKSGQALLPHMHSKLGPGVAVGDVNGDRLEDFVIGGAAGASATLFLQQPEGTFKSKPLPLKQMEDMGIVLFDSDNDGDLDLYCASGSSEFGREAGKYKHRFYRNEGGGEFVLDANALPPLTSSAGCVIANDFDKDGDLDLFVAGRVVPLQYPSPPESYLLLNDGRGRFSDVTVSLAPALRSIGMVTSALWSDVDNDGFSDLVMVGEWMPITVYRNVHGKKFERVSARQFEHTVGWWNSIVGSDFDSDGDTDYVAGNLGRNSIFQASETEPVSVYADDFDGNGSFDPIICRFIEGSEYPTHYRESMTDQIPSLRRSLFRYSVYGKATLKNLLPENKLDRAITYKANLFKSCYIENKGQGDFAVRPLPIAAQTAPVFGMLVTDVNLDGNPDVVAVGNSYSSETASGFYDAGIGVVLQGDGRGNFKSVHVNNSGFFVDSDAKGFAELIHGNKKRLWLVTSNSDSLRVFAGNDADRSDVIPLHGGDLYAIVLMKDGRKQKREFYFGSGYLSQSSRSLIIPATATDVTIYDVKGSERKVRVSDR